MKLLLVAGMEIIMNKPTKFPQSWLHAKKKTSIFVSIFLLQKSALNI